MSDSNERDGSEIKRFSISPLGFKGEDIRADMKEKYNYEGDLGDIFVSNEGSIVHKWHHYFPIYERYFAPYRGKDFKFLEIGVSKGGSLRMWRKYFGEKATIFGVDIDEKCARFNGESGQVRIGSQDDEEFLLKTVEEMGGVDVILDDGSHDMKHVRKTLQVLFPKLSNPGIYMIEDMHTAYWGRWSGGVKSENNIFELMRELTDDMHKWYHKSPIHNDEISRNLWSMAVYDSILVLEKSPVYPPVHSKVGSRRA